MAQDDISAPRPWYSRNIVDAAKHQLTFNWLRKPVCQAHSECHCRKPFFDLYEILRWMDAKQPEQSLPNGRRLVATLNPIKPDFFEEEEDPIFQLESPCVLVLVYLLWNNWERLIYLFCDAGFSDKAFSTPHVSFTTLKRHLKKLAKYTDSDIATMIANFEENKWAFCPAHIRGNLSREQRFPADTRLPYFKLTRINQKGGMASIIKVSIQEQFVSGELKQRLGPAPHKDESYGQYYQLVIKTYEYHQRKDYLREKKAFSGLRRLGGVLRCFGFYSHGDEDESHRDEMTFNLILELGEMDLYEWFSERKSPQRTEEILESYKAILKVAKAVEQIHDYKHASGNYYGWHGDIKPDNMLRVNNEWKLADFGFAEFELAPSETTVFDRARSPTKMIQGGTLAYGAPDRGSTKSQTIDVWSFGCVLSVVATWIVIGLRGVQDFENHRWLASKKRGAQWQSNAFHDGEDVFPDIRDWHEYLNEVMRKSDFVTSDILALVDARMLRKEPSDRLSFAELCHELGQIIAHAETLLKKAPKPRPDNHVKQTLLMTEIQQTREALHSYKIADLSHTGQYLQIPMEISPGSSSSSMRRIGRRTLSVAHRELTLSQSVQVEIKSEEPIVPEAISMPHRTPSPQVSARDSDPYIARESSTSSEHFTLERFWTAVRDVRSPAFLVPLMLEHNPEFSDACTKSKRTPIMEAALKFNLPVVELLLDCSELERTDSGGQSVLHLLVSALAQRVRSPADCENFSKVLRKLQSKKPHGEALINKADHSGDLPLSLCVSSPPDVPMLRIMRMLIKAGARISPSEGESGTNVLMQAVLEGHFLVVELLFEEGGTISREEIDISTVESSKIKHLIKQEWKRREEDVRVKRRGLGGIFRRG